MSINDNDLKPKIILDHDLIQPSLCNHEKGCAPRIETFLGPPADIDYLNLIKFAKGWVILALLPCSRI